MSKQSPKSAVLSATCIYEGRKVPPQKAGNPKRIFEDAVLSPSFNNRLNRVIDSLNNPSVNESMEKRVKLYLDEDRILNDRSKLNIDRSYRNIHDRYVVTINSKKFTSREVSHENELKVFKFKTSRKIPKLIQRTTGIKRSSVGTATC